MSIIRKTGIGFLFLFALWGCNDSEFTAAGCESTNSCNTVIQNATASWDTGVFSRCSLTCGGGQRTRIVRCLSAQGVVVPDSECGGTKPSSTESCNSQTCTAPYDWNIGPYSACSATCGGGTKNRIVQCQDTATALFVADNICPTTKPATTMSCNTNPCPPEVYTWELGTPSACTQTCGGGTNTRTVICKNSSGVVSAENLCPSPKPSLTNACNTQSCTFSYTWVEGSWGTCSKTCGGGVQSRSLGCRRDDGVFVPHTLCTAPQPAVTRTCNTQACAPTCTTHQISETIPASRNELDILVVVDDSGSMYQDTARLAAKLSSFTNQLQSSHIDWQMCITSTDVDYFQGRPIQWQGGNSGHILKKTSGNLSSIFTDTMRWIGAGFSSDEQAIKAINLSIKDNGRSNCYRRNASLAILIISDEDERSVGGVQALFPQQYQPLGPLNMPSSVMTTINTEFGTGKRVSVHPIIVKDSQCKAQQDAQGEISFFGTKYQQLYSQIGGSLHSICEPDYGVTLSQCHHAILQTLGTVKLNCVPQSTPTVLVNGGSYAPFITVVGDEIIFNPVVVGPATVTGSYCCQ